MSPQLSPREAMEAYEAARASIRVYEAAKASALSKPLNVRVVEVILWVSIAGAVACALASVAEALGVYPFAFAAR